jgi:hypothetical protein
VPRGVPNLPKLEWVRVCAPLPVRKLYVGIDAPIWKSMREVLIDASGGEGDRHF